MSKKYRNKKVSRKALAATMSLVFMISLSACSGAVNTNGKIDANEVYAKAGDFKITYGELWNELKWNSSSVVDQQIETVVLDKYINQIETSLTKTYSEYEALPEKERTLDVDSEEAYNELKSKYEDRLVDYVVQDIYNLNYSSKNYWDSVDKIDAQTSEYLEAKYIDEIYTGYQVNTINNKTIAELIDNKTIENKDNYLTIATELSELYYPLCASELLAYEKFTEEVKKADDEDTDKDDDKLGYFTVSDYISNLKSEYTKKYDVNLIAIRFTDNNELDDTLRAFGLKVYNNNVYFIDFENDGTTNLTYDEYVEKYDDINVSKLNTSDYINISSNMQEAMLEIYIQIYNYLYGGYRTSLPTSLTSLPEINELNDLRNVTKAILSQYNNNASAKYEATKNLVLEQNEIVNYTRDELNELTNNTVNYIYDTLNTNLDECFSKTAQTYNSSKYLFYKLSEGEKSELEQKFYDDGYTKDSTNDWILTNILEKNEELTAQIRLNLIENSLTETSITNYLDEECDEVGVKVYVEACEINYAISNPEYNKTKSKADNKNMLAKLSYNGKDWNLNIKADSNDKNSVLIPGSNEAFGAFDYLESQMGATTAIDLLTNKIIKTTNAYKETSKEKDVFVNNIDVLLSNFKNGAYNSSGYPASIGKYDFLMAYFHSADIDDIVNDFYRVQYASAKLLTNYSSDQLISFFKKFTDSLYDKYFSLSGTRLVVYFDGDDNTKEDEIYFDDNYNLIETSEGKENWVYKTVEFEGQEVYLGEVAKDLIFEIYKEIAASTDDHSTVMSDLVSEINGSARVIYNNNPIVVENTWAKYRKLGLRVTTKEFKVSNTSTDESFALKQRLYDYKVGQSLDADGNVTATYNYFVNNTVPSAYIEPLDESDIDITDNTILATEDGYNLILVTEGSTSPSAKWSEDDYKDTILKDIKIKYNDKYTADTVISNVFNEDDKLNEKQIKLYVLEYVTSNTSNLSAKEINSALTTFISPVLTRYTGEETQRVILLNFIKHKVNPSAPIYQTIVFTNESYNGEDGYLNNLFKINQSITDGYNHIYNDITGTSDTYNFVENGVEKDWWTALEESVGNFLIEDGGQE